MKRSFRRLVTASVLGAWAIGFVGLFAWIRSSSWTEDQAQGDGVFLFYELVDQTPAAQRQARLSELQPHSSIEFSLVSTAEVEQRVGRAVQPGDQLSHRVSFEGEWCFQVFSDGQGALAAGPVIPGWPRGTVPVGAILAIIGVPAIAGLIAMRVERELNKVERASEALAVGEFSARVDNAQGPSRELAQTFNAMAERIERLVRSRDELVQAVSHELGSPLSRLRFHMELLADLPGEEREQRLRAMTQELDTLDDLVAELLSYVQSEDLELNQRVFDPRQGLDDIAELARLEVPEERPIGLEVRPLPEGLRVFADQRLFLRAVENILRNAMRYAAREVRVEVIDENGQVRIDIDDDGPGIPEDMRHKVTVPFVRLDPHRGRKTGGVGLGLAIVSRIVRRHGGHVEIGTSPLGGARVSTRWPPQT